MLLFSYLPRTWLLPYSSLGPLVIESIDGMLVVKFLRAWMGRTLFWWS